MFAVPRQALLKTVIVWVAILLVAITNGALRDLVLVNLLGPTVARFVSGIVLCVIILVAAALTARWFGSLPLASRWYIGGFWLVLTLGFELSVGYAQHQSWQRLLDAYTLQGGNLWPLVLVTTFIAPWAGARIRGVT
ncbi:MAG: hypothetical protein IPO38_09200 [Rhodocyclaceae bacterium]|nr:hypothetical protein [Rhodocyclaceae bacterium]